MKRLSLFALVAAVASAMVFGGPALAGDPRFATPVEATLAGPDDPNGSGVAYMKLYPVKNKICYTMNVEDIQLPATEAHLHRGSAGQTGDVVLRLNAPRADGSSDHECIRGLSTGFIRKIKRDLSNHYVDVRNNEFSNGAVRGQLVRSP